MTDRAIQLDGEIQAAPVPGPQAVQVEIPMHPGEGAYEFWSRMAEAARIHKIAATPRSSLRHTCILDDGGTPGRRCDACDDERRPLPPRRPTTHRW